LTSEVICDDGSVLSLTTPAESEVIRRRPEFLGIFILRNTEHENWHDLIADYPNIEFIVARVSSVEFGWARWSKRCFMPTLHSLSQRLHNRSTACLVKLRICQYAPTNGIGLKISGVQLASLIYNRWSLPLKCGKCTPGSNFPLLACLIFSSIDSSV
jgi:hypothetical protein